MDIIPPEALIDDFPHPMRAIAARLRDVVSTAIPEAVERVRPGWHLIGYYGSALLESGLTRVAKVRGTSRCSKRRRNGR